MTNLDSPPSGTRGANPDALAAAGRVAETLVAGTVDGIKDNVEYKITHPVELGQQVGIACAMGFGISLLNKGGTRGKLCAQALTAGMALAAAADIGGRGLEIKDALADSAGSADNLQHNKEVIASTMGPFAVDSILFSQLGTAAALRTAHASKVSDLEMSLNLAGKPQNSVFGLRGDVSNGTGWVVSDRRGGVTVATAAHVAFQQGPFAEALFNNKAIADVNYTMAHPTRDIALGTIDRDTVRSSDRYLNTFFGGQPDRGLPPPLSMTTGAVAQPGEEMVALGTKIVPVKEGDELNFAVKGRTEPVVFDGSGTWGDALGKASLPDKGGLYLVTALGRLAGALGIKFDSNASNAHWFFNPVVLGKGDLHPGMSGGPLLTAVPGEGVKVVGMNNWKVNIFSSVPGGFEPADDVRWLAGIADRSKLKGSNITVKTAAQRLGMDQSVVVSKIRSGDLEAFLAPPLNYTYAVAREAGIKDMGSIWDYRVMWDSLAKERMLQKGLLQEQDGKLIPATPPLVAYGAGYTQKRLPSLENA